MQCQWPYEVVSVAFEAIPQTLAQNCGVNVIRAMTSLQGKEWIICGVSDCDGSICRIMVVYDGDGCKEHGMNAKGFQLRMKHGDLRSKLPDSMENHNC